MPITKKTSVGKIIDDFENSDNKRFAGKSSEERRKMALGAYYSKHPEKSNKNESFTFQDLDNGNVRFLGEDGAIIFEWDYPFHTDTIADRERPTKPAAAKKPDEPHVDIPPKPTTGSIHHIKVASGMVIKHHGTSDSAAAHAKKIGGTVVPKTESIENFIRFVSQGDRVSAMHALQEMLMDRVTDRLEAMKEAVAKKHLTIPMDEAALSAKAGAAGKDLGKPGKNFDKVANKAAAEYGSKAAGQRVAGAVLAHMRAKAGVKGGEGH